MFLSGVRETDTADLSVLVDSCILRFFLWVGPTTRDASDTRRLGHWSTGQERQHVRAVGDETSRIQLPVAREIVGPNMVKSHGLSHIGKPIHSLHEIPQMGVVENMLLRRFKMDVVDRVKANQRCKQTDVSNGQFGTTNVQLLAKPLVPLVQG